MTEMTEQIAERLPMLRRYALSLTRNEADAEDLVQDCVERAITRAHQFRPGTSMDAWLSTIARSIFINGKRRERLVRDHARMLKHASDNATEPSQEHHMALCEVQQMLVNLSPDQRRSIELLGLEQRSHREAANEMNVPVATVKTRLHRAREKLRTAMAA